jgi:hypothetical protein
MNAIAQKDFPANYATPLLRVLDALSMTDLKGLEVVGSASIRSQQYAGDYDAHEVVKAKTVESVAAKLQDIVKDVRTLNGVYFGDIKIGEIPDWNIFNANARVVDGKVSGFNRTESKGRVDALRQQNIISPAEAKEAHALLTNATDPLSFLEARKTLRFHILRWRPADILEGAMVYRDKVIKLEDAIASGGLVKVDAIANFNDRFTELSVIYDIFINGERLTASPAPLVPSLIEDIAYYSESNPFKALKRTFSLARHYKTLSVIKTLVPVLNSDLGRLYQLIGDMSTLVDLLERPNAPVSRIREAIDDFRSRLGFIYDLPDVLRDETETLGEIVAILKLPSPSRMRDRLASLRDDLQRKLDLNTKKEVKTLGKLKTS